MLSNCGAGEDSWESLGQQGYQTSQSKGKSTLNIQWKDWCWSWSSSILVIWWKLPAYWKSLLCWERLRTEGEKGIRGWDGWMALPMQGHELGRSLGYGEGQGGLVCCIPQGCLLTQLGDRTTVIISLCIFVKTSYWSPETHIIFIY